MMKSLTEGPVERLMKVIPATTTTLASTVEKALREYDADELLRYQADNQAKSNLILALPNSICNRIDCFKQNPMLMWTQLEKIMLGSTVSTQLRQTRISTMPIQELYEILMTDESMVLEKKAKLDKKNKPKTVDPIALLDKDDGEALENAMILLSQHYQKKFQRRTGSNNLRFTSGSKKVEPGAPSKPYLPKYEPAKVVKDSDFYRNKMEVAEKRENGTILMAEEEYWLDHSDNEAENEETAAMCFIGDDKSDDEEDATSTDDSEEISEFHVNFVSSQLNVIVNALHDFRSKFISEKLENQEKSVLIEKLKISLRDEKIILNDTKGKFQKNLNDLELSNQTYHDSLSELTVLNKSLSDKTIVLEENLYKRNQTE
ncbi:hypothetical protein L6452_19071 [Arctium lappa]|uniref:Uncharacterized protein n=1 Tax=Arctium lappa TaxID=4217 RepID=A0ACB9B8F3_ARCLA|nr:hypothetical protein L6452_19071 [Arctium lappa]